QGRLPAADDKGKRLRVVAGRISRIKGGRGNNTILGPAKANKWVVLGMNSGFLLNSDGELDFDSIANITGGSVSDIFAVSPAGGVTGVITHGLGTNVDGSALPERDAAGNRITQHYLGGPYGSYVGYIDSNNQVVKVGPFAAKAVLIGPDGDPTAAVPTSVTYDVGANSGFSAIEAGDAYNTFILHGSNLPDVLGNRKQN